MSTAEERERDLRLFHSDPPRLLPHIDYHRPVIEALLAQEAANPNGHYEERFEAYNALCDKYGVPRFGRVTVVREESPPEPSRPAEPVVTDTAMTEMTTDQPAEETLDKPKKKGKKKKADTQPLPPADHE